MLISIITPTYNSGKYIEECILSIKNQMSDNYEHIIIDGGSTDSTITIIKKYENTYRMRWISEPDNGMYDAISKGFHLAEGEIFCWLNSDDRYMPWTCSAVEKIFQNRNVAWCSGVPVQMNSMGILYMMSDQIIKYPKYCIKMGWMDGQRCGCIQQESCFWRRDLYEKVGGIDTQYKLAGDYHLWCKFSEHTKLYSYNTILASFRVHDGQKSHDRIRYCAEAHHLTLFERILCALKVYKLINWSLKHFVNVKDIRKI